MKLQYKQTVVLAERIVCGYVTYGIQNADADVTNNKLILAAAAAYQKYSVYLSQNIKESSTEQSEKRKVSQDELEQLQKKRTLQKDKKNTAERCRCCWKEADDLAIKAEEKHELSCIDKAKTAKQTLAALRWLTCSQKVSSGSAGAADMSTSDPFN